MTLQEIPETGRFLVETMHSSYVIDMDAKTFERQPVHTDASHIEHIDGKETTFRAIDVSVGEPLWISTPVGFLRSTPVASIVAAP